MSLPVDFDQANDVDLAYLASLGRSKGCSNDTGHANIIHLVDLKLMGSTCLANSVDADAGYAGPCQTNSRHPAAMTVRDYFNCKIVGVGYMIDRHVYNCVQR